MFYYLLAGASEEERKSFHLLKPEEYHYLNQVGQRSQVSSVANDDSNRVNTSEMLLRPRACWLTVKFWLD